VQVDSKLRWGPHIKKTAEKGTTQIQSLQRLCKSTWGASFLKARHLYTAVVRPVLTFGSKIWDTLEGIPGRRKGLTKPIEKVQSQALQHITGAYKSTPTVVLQQEAEIPPLALYTQELIRQQAQKDHDSPSTTYIQTRYKKVAQECRVRTRRSLAQQEQPTKQGKTMQVITT
jgi:hypothetical protein